MRMQTKRGSGQTPRPLWRRVAKSAFALAASLSIVVSFAGCKSGGCSSCGLGDKLGNGVRSTTASVRDFSSRVFNHKRGGVAYGTSGSCCGGDAGIPTEGVVEYGGIPVSPGGLAPSGSGQIAEPAAPSILEPAPKAKSLPPEEKSSLRSSSGTMKSTFESTSPRSNSRARSNNVALSPSAKNQARGPVPVNPLDDLPPLEIPRPDAASELKPTADEAPVIPTESTQGASAPAASVAPASAGVIESSPVETAPVVPSPEPKATESVSPPLPPPASPAPPATAQATPGIAPFRLAVVEPGLAGGTVPSKDDMIKLISLGYKTIIDLRTPDEVHPLFIACATNHGLRYVALPVTPETFDASRINRFNLELAQTDARPIFFFDSGGVNSAALWSIHRQAIDKVDAQVARRDAEEIGKIDVARAAVIEKYLATIRPAGTVPAPVAPAPPELNTPPRPTAAAATPASPPVSPPSPTTAEVSVPTPPKTAAAWRPYAVLALTVLGLPLAYWSRTASYQLPTARATLASLPAKVRPLRALPRGSDV